MEDLERDSGRMIKEKRRACLGIIVFIGACLISFIYCRLLHSLGTFGGDSGYYVAQAQEMLENGLKYYRDHIATPYYWGYPAFLAACMAVIGGGAELDCSSIGSDIFICSQHRIPVFAGQ